VPNQHQHTMRGGAVSLVLEEIPDLVLPFRSITNHLHRLDFQLPNLVISPINGSHSARVMREIRHRHLEVIALAHEILHALNSCLEEKSDEI